MAERMGVAALSLGIIEECLRLSTDYAQTRTLWGQEIGRYQLIQLKLAQMEIARINVQNMVFRAVELVRVGKMPDIAEASAMKLYSSQSLMIYPGSDEIQVTHFAKGLLGR